MGVRGRKGRARKGRGKNPTSLMGLYLVYQSYLLEGKGEAENKASQKSKRTLIEEYICRTPCRLPTEFSPEGVSYFLLIKQQIGLVRIRKFSSLISG